MLTIPRCNVDVLALGSLALVNKDIVENDRVDSQNGEVYLEEGAIHEDPIEDTCDEPNHYQCVHI